MKAAATALPDVLLIDLDLHEDTRGFFVERYHEEKLSKFGLPAQWRQDNHSRSRHGVLRGLHYQLERPQGKLVSCVRGSVYDVAVDIRIGSPTFARWVGVTLTDDRPQLLWIPDGFAHGFCALSDTADLTYKCTEVYVPSAEHGILWSDPEIGIAWPVTDPQLSPRDRALPTLGAARDKLPRYVRAAR